MNAAKEHLSKLVPNAKEDLKELAFPDRDGLEIQRHLAGLGCTKLSFAMRPVLVGLNTQSKLSWKSQIGEDQCTSISKQKQSVL